MTVQKIFANGSILELDQVSVQDAVQNTLLRSSILCNDSHYSEGKAIGDPTEIASLVDYYEKVFSIVLKPGKHGSDCKKSHLIPIGN